MKLFMVTTSIVLLAVLAFTKSLYVEPNEIILIIATILLLSMVYCYGNGQKSFMKNMYISLLFGFLLCWIFGVMDLIVDHYLYFSRDPFDGVKTSLIFTIQEYSDDLFVASVISMFVTVTVSMISSAFHMVKVK